MQAYFLRILTRQPGRYVVLQLLQTMSILFENIRNETSICKTTHLFIYPSILQLIHSSIYLSIFQLIHPFICHSHHFHCLSIYLSIYHLSIYLFIHLSLQTIYSQIIMLTQLLY